MEAALIAGAFGILGTVAGVLLQEYIRRKSRVEHYSREVYQKRLEAHEKLYLRVNKCYREAMVLLNDKAMSEEERHAFWSEAILDLTGFCDRNGLYLEEEVAFHCMVTFVGVEDIASERNAKKREEMTDRLVENYKEAKKMLKEVIGLSQIEESFRSVANAETDSEYTRLLNRMINEKEQEV